MTGGVEDVARRRLDLAARAAFAAFGHDVAEEMPWEDAPEDFRITFRMVADAVLTVADSLSDGRLAEAEAKVLQDVREERRRQDAKWGEQNHAPAVWLAILTEEVGEFAEAVLHDLAAPGDERNHTHSEDMRTEVVQIAAVAAQIAEAFDRAALSGGEAGS